MHKILSRAAVLIGILSVSLHTRCQEQGFTYEAVVPERDYATKNMLTLAQNEHVADSVVAESSPAASVVSDSVQELTTQATAAEGIKIPETQTPVEAVEPVAPAIIDSPSVDAVSPEVPVTHVQKTEKAERKAIRNGNGARKSQGSDNLGIDTVNIDEPEGNWLYKRKYWEQAEYRYEKIKALLDQIIDVRMDFYKKQMDVDQHVFDPFYVEIGFKEGNIVPVLDDLFDYMDKERKEQGGLDQEERDFLLTLQEQRATLEQLKQDVSSIQKIDAAIQEAMLVVFNMIDQARGFERQSWQNFKDIARELSDKKAHNLYYAIETYWQNMKDIHVYMSTQLSSYFQQLISKAQEQTAAVHTAMDSLKERGVDLKAHAQRMEQAELDKARAGQEASQTQKAPAKQGILRRFIGGIGSTISSVWQQITKAVSGAWHSVKGMLSGLFTKKTAGKPVVLPEAPMAPEGADQVTVGGSAEQIPETAEGTTATAVQEVVPSEQREMASA